MTLSAAAAEALLQKLRDDFRARLPERLAVIAQHYQLFAAGNSEESEPLQRALHSLVGAAGTFGLPEISGQARELENRVRAGTAVHDGRFLSDLAAMALVAGDAITTPGKANTSISPPPPTDTSTAQAIFYYDSANHSEALLAQLARYQLPVTLCHDVENLQHIVESSGHAVSVVIDIGADLPFESHVLKRLDRTKLCKHKLILLSSRRDFVTCLQAAKCGAQALLNLPLVLPDLIDVLGQPGLASDGTPYRVLIVDDDRSVAMYHASILKSAGMQVQICADIPRLDALVQDFAPELILLDLYMPDWDGPDIARALRMESQFLAMPLVFLSSEADRTVQLDALREGGDDFLVKPVAPAHFIEAVSIRAQRYRELRTAMMTDPLTHVLNRRALFSGIERELSRARRLKSPVTVAVLDLDHFKTINDKQGHHIGDAVLKGLTQLLRQRLRKTDLIGRMGGEEFLVLFPETDHLAAWALLDDIRQQFLQINYLSGDAVLNASFSAGLAQWQPDQSTAEWLSRVDQLLYQAKTEGRNRVVSAD